MASPRSKGGGLGLSDEVERAQRHLAPVGEARRLHLALPVPKRRHGAVHHLGAVDAALRDAEALLLQRLAAITVADPARGMARPEEPSGSAPRADAEP